MPTDDLLTTGQAQQLLGVSRRTMARLIATGELHTQMDPLDRRIKLIRRSEVDALLARSSKLEKVA
jgi:excisionase family DNA binding protein